MRKKSFFIAFICCLFLIACERTEWEGESAKGRNRIVFRLRTGDYEGGDARVVPIDGGSCDRVEYYVTDRFGDVVDNFKSQYDPATSELYLEGLHEGEYNLLVLGIDGDMEQDGAVVHELEHQTDEWISFPSDLHRPLKAEYFYSQTPFAVTAVQGPDGEEEIASFSADVSLKRMVGRADFSFSFANEYVKNAVTSQKVQWGEVRFRTGFSGDGVFSGETDGIIDEMDLLDSSSCYFLPTVDNSSLSGEIEILTRDYLGNRVRRVFSFNGTSVSENRIGKIHTPVSHPDDERGTMFLSAVAYEAGRYGKILQDDERKEVYADSGQRSFNTAEPLQVGLTDEGQLHLRFYSPKPLSDVLLKARFPGVEQEYIDLAYFDELPAFADFYQNLPLLAEKGVYRTESGRNIHLSPRKLAELKDVEFKIESSDPYWNKLQNIKHGWNISFGLYGGDPDKEDGGVSGNWMGIRPVHCREVVALFLNFTYMIDMPEHEEILKENEEQLYGNGGKEDKVTAEVVLRQMRQTRSIQVGLVYSGNNVLGLGGGNVFGAYQGAWLSHYNSAYACEILFHELGHVMGYSHNSSFTYGPWAQKLMNNFYVTHLHDMPVESPEYLDSKNNPNLYKN